MSLFWWSWLLFVVAITVIPAVLLTFGVIVAAAWVLLVAYAWIIDINRKAKK